MFESTDNQPVEWGRRGKRNILREQITANHNRRLLVDLVKYATVCILNSAFEADEIVDEWIKLIEKKES